MPVIFVHGVTVRRERFNELVNKFTNGLLEQQFAGHVEGFFWGDLGSSLRNKGDLRKVTEVLDRGVERYAVGTSCAYCSTGASSTVTSSKCDSPSGPANRRT